MRRSSLPFLFRLAMGCVSASIYLVLSCLLLRWESIDSLVLGNMLDLGSWTVGPRA